jgi:hypothetical protein
MVQKVSLVTVWIIVFAAVVAVAGMMNGGTPD